MLFSFKAFSRIYFALVILGIILVGGSLGFMVIEKYSFFDAFYMTIITISTVGFQEVHQLSTEGRIFTSILIITSIGGFAYGISAITTYFVGGEYRNIIRKAKVEKDLSTIRDHVIVCGYGRVGLKASADLKYLEEQFIVVEKSDDKLKLLYEQPGMLVVEGDATVDRDLCKAGIERAKAIITTLPNDADNLYVVLTARELNSKVTIISRASKAESVKKLRIAGANNVIMPDSVGGAHMASLVVTPDVMDFLDHISVQGVGDINLEEVTFKDLPENFQFKTLGEMQIRNRIGVNIIGFKSENGEYVINPGPDTQILPNSKFFVLGNKHQIKLLNRLFGINPPG
ncbi:MAG: potassium channel protein [Flavobacteriales bacterium]|nr:potassium channel protein [Flavobacteriales bacterium]